MKEYTMNILNIIKDENGKIQDIELNGKPVKRGFMRGIRKAQETPYWTLFEDGGVGRNMYSGVEVILDALELSIYKWLLDWYARYLRGVNDAPIQTYDDMKYFFLELNANAYYDLID